MGMQKKMYHEHKVFNRPINWIDVSYGPRNYIYTSGPMDQSFVYIMQETLDVNHTNINYGSKIGVSNNPKRRLKQIMDDEGHYNIELIFSCGFPSQKMAFDVETYLHREWAEVRESGEWFDLYDFEIVDVINELITLSDIAELDPNEFYQLLLSKKKNVRDTEKCRLENAMREAKDDNNTEWYEELLEDYNWHIKHYKKD